MLGGHRNVVKILMENGADINSGDVGHFACTAAEQNNLELLKEIVQCGGDVTRARNNGSTALHVAVSEDNTEIVRFLLDQGADIDKGDIHNWTPRDLAEQQGHEEIKFIFQSYKEKTNLTSAVSLPEQHQQGGVRFLGRFTSEPNIRQYQPDGSLSGTDGSWTQRRIRRRTNNFHNSLFGIMSATHSVEKDFLYPISNNMDDGKSSATGSINSARVTISCPDAGQVKGKLVLLPGSFRELLEIGAKKFGISPAKVLNKDGAEIDDIEVIRDGDHIVFVGSNGDVRDSSNHDGDL